MSDPRRQDVLAWLQGLGRPALDLTPLAGDVSRRVYLRARHENGDTSIVVTYPPEIVEECRRFAHTTLLLEPAGVPVPRVEARDCANGLMLLTDAGGDTLYDRRREGWETLSGWIGKAARIADAFRRVPAGEVAALNPPLDAELLRRELDQTWRLLLEPRGLAGDRAGSERLRTALDEICARLGGERRVVCHRDFMARNLVPRDDGGLVVLDHQDLRLGPGAYDLASLLNDSLFAPADLESRLVKSHLPDTPLESYRRCVVQRALKACGTYAAFARRGSSRHLRLVPPTLRRAADNLAQLPEGRGLSTVIERWRSAPALGSE